MDNAIEVSRSTKKMAIQGIHCIRLKVSLHDLSDHRNIKLHLDLHLSSQNHKRRGNSRTPKPEEFQYWVCKPNIHLKLQI